MGICSNYNSEYLRVLGTNDTLTTRDNALIGIELELFGRKIENYSRELYKSTTRQNFGTLTILIIEMIWLMSS